MTVTPEASAPSLPSDSAVPGREVKFGQMLESLIERGGYSRNRKKILRALDISAAALSQYVREQTRPSFGKLLAIAEFFDVSLDYLVYGQPTSSLIDYGPLYRYVDHALANVQARNTRHSAIVTRIGRVLAERIDSVARDIATAPAAAREGLIQDDELLQLEAHCKRVDILSLNLEFDVIHVEGGIAAGRFLPVVAANVERGVYYRFLLPHGDRDWASTVAECRRLLTGQIGGDLVREQCAFRRTRLPVLTGAGLYQLDIARFEATQPALHAQVSDYLGAEGWFGCVMRPNEDSNNDMIMDPAQTRRARDIFDTLWVSGEAV